MVQISTRPVSSPISIFWILVWAPGHGAEYGLYQDFYQYYLSTLYVLLSVIGGIKCSEVTRKTLFKAIFHLKWIYMLLIETDNVKVASIFYRGGRAYFIVFYVMITNKFEIFLVMFSWLKIAFLRTKMHYTSKYERDQKYLKFGSSWSSQL